MDKVPGVCRLCHITISLFACATLQLNFYLLPRHSLTWLTVALSMLCYTYALCFQVSSNWGFTDSNLGISAHGVNTLSMWTHADAICYLQPHTAPYTYDTLP